MNSARSGSLAPVAESDERRSSGSLQSGDSSFLEYEAQFRRPGKTPDSYTASDEGGSTLSMPAEPSQISTPVAYEEAQELRK